MCPVWICHKKAMQTIEDDGSKYAPSASPCCLQPPPPRRRGHRHPTFPPVSPPSRVRLRSLPVAEAPSMKGFLRRRLTTSRRPSRTCRRASDRALAATASRDGGPVPENRRGHGIPAELERARGRRGHRMGAGVHRDIRRSVQCVNWSCSFLPSPFRPGKGQMASPSQYIDEHVQLPTEISRAETPAECRASWL